MGMSTENDIVPYVVHSYFMGQFVPPTRCTETVYIFANPEMAMEEPYDPTVQPSTSLNVSGWECKGSESLGKRKRVFGFRWEKDGNVVWTINEDPYEHVGEASVALVAEDENSLHAFMADIPHQSGIMDYEPTIECTDTVEQTM